MATKYVQKFGRNTDIDAAEDIIDQGDDYNWIASAVTPTIESAHASDDAVGVGARTVKVQGLDDDYNEQSEIVTLDGTNAVNLANSYIRVFRAHVVTAGGSGPNVGNIDVKAGDDVVARIPAAMGQTLQAIYTIPAGYSGIITNWWCYPVIGANQSLDLGLMTRATGSNAWRVREWITLRTGGTLSRKFEDGMGTKCSPMDDVKIRVLDVSGTNEVVAGGFDIAMPIRDKT